ncbi:MAG: zinc ribbon domain-containing protein [Thermoplasmata archaeon]
MKRRGQWKKFRKILVSWLPSELQKYIKYKAEYADKIVLYVNPKHKSQRSSRCGYINKNHRHVSVFRYGIFCFEFNAYLNASRNIEVFFIYEYLRSQQDDRCGSMKLHSWVEGKHATSSEALARNS